MEEIFKLLGFDDRIIEFSKGNNSIIDNFSMFSFYSKVKNENSYPHPPFLIPLLVSFDADIYYIGIIKHWFLNREITFGDMTCAVGFTTTEIARNTNQFLNKLLFDEFVNIEDCILTDKIIKCAKEFNIEENFGEKYLAVAHQKKDNNLCGLDGFSKKIPLDCITDVAMYDGDFPSNYFFIIEKKIQQSCFCEVYHKEWIGYKARNRSLNIFTKPKYKTINNIPEWLKPDSNKKKLFDLYISNGDYGKAWLTINGPGFSPLEVSERMKRLTDFSEEESFHLWVDYWSEKYCKNDNFIFM